MGSCFAKLLEEYFDMKISSNTSIEALRLKYKELASIQHLKLLNADKQIANITVSKRKHLANYVASKVLINEPQDNFVSDHDKRMIEVNSFFEESNKKLRSEKENYESNTQLIKSQLSSLKEKLSELESDQKKIQKEYEQYVLLKNKYKAMKNQ